MRIPRVQGIRRCVARVCVTCRRDADAGLHERGVRVPAKRCTARLHYAELTGVRHHVYPQQLLVADLIEALRAADGDVAFGRAAAAIRIAERPVIVLVDGDEVSCDFVLGCDGFHGVSRLALEGSACSGVDFGADLLSLLAEVPPSSDHVVYGLHPDGFAGHMLRSRTASRLYPGGKGMNLALQDADELVAGLLDQHRVGDDRRLNAYSATCLPAVWRAVEFSHWMLDLLLARPTEGRFREGLRETRLARLMPGGLFAEEFAINYVGLPEAS
jgi:2-polyprenyl-6-methoxyphenol hydroxylase-like FAD-dependent oxidoreductase